MRRPGSMCTGWGANRPHNAMTDPIVLITNPRASSGLGVYVADALSAAGATPDCIDPMGSRWRKVGPALRSIRLRRDAMWKARWETMVFSSRAWDRNTRHIGRRLEALGWRDRPLLLVGKEYFPHPDYRTLNYAVFIHHTMRLALADGVTPWLPPHNDRSRFLEREGNLYRHAKAVFVGARYVEENLVAEYGVARDRVVVAGGGPHPWFEAHPAPDIARSFTGRIIFVGWDFGMKGGQYLLEAFALARRVRPELTLDIVGPNPGPDRPGVRWRGPVRSREALADLYRQSDLFVMPSLRDSFGFVFLEAMTQGVPCIGTDLNAMPEIIDHGRTGYIVPARNPEALADAILGYYAEESNRHVLGCAARDRARERYTWSRVAGLILDRWAAPPDLR